MTSGILDVETTIFQKGNPFAERNRLCVAGVRINGINHIIPIEYDETEPYAERLSELRGLLDQCSTIVLFNGKFDLNWLNRYGLVLRDDQQVWDCQLCEFLINDQQIPYPSLDSCLGKYQLPTKHNFISENYWSKGIDTNRIPYNELKEYLEQDLLCTQLLYDKQLDQLPESKRRLFNLQCQDLRILQEMEFNGQVFAWEKLEQRARQVESDLNELDRRLREYVPSELQGSFNFNSGDHLSRLLYGGTLSVKVGTEYQRTYKSGARAGETVTAHKWELREYTFPQLVKPPKGSELKKDGFYSTDEQTLLSLPRKSVGKLVDLLLKQSELEKLRNTYLRGLPEIAAKYDWKDGKIHGTFNQCRVITGRLSSEKPNQQNYPKELNEYIITRFS